MVYIADLSLANRSLRISLERFFLVILHAILTFSYFFIVGHKPSNPRMQPPKRSSYCTDDKPFCQF
jgi:hypothetical protein